MRKVSVLVAFSDGEEKLEFGRNVAFDDSCDEEAVRSVIKQLNEQGKRSVDLYIRRLKEKEMFGL